MLSCEDSLNLMVMKAMTIAERWEIAVGNRIIMAAYIMEGLRSL